jgi:hypothetical protein
MDRTVHSDSRTINNITAELVKTNMEVSYRRIKEIYVAKHNEIEKIEEKIAKLSEKIIPLKEEREVLENELNGIQQSYHNYCKETGLKPAFESFKG